MSSTRRIAALLVAGLLGVSCTPAGTSAPSAASPRTSGTLTKVTLLVGFRPDVQFAPFYLAQQQGIYRDAGLDVAIEYKTGADVARLVASGAAEFGVADATDVMIGRTSGIPMKYVGTLYDQFPVAIIGPAGKVPTSPAGLKGKRIGTPGRFGSSWHALLALLAAGGLTPNDVTIREYPQFNQADGLLRGDVDLITGFRNNEPLLLEARGMKVGLLTVDQVAPLPGPGVIVADRELSARPQLVRAFVRATAKAQAAVIADVSAGLRAAETAVPAIRDAKATARRVLEATATLWKGSAGFGNGVIDVSRWRRAAEIMKSLGFIDGSVPVDAMIAPQVLGT